MKERRACGGKSSHRIVLVLQHAVVCVAPMNYKIGSSYQNLQCTAACRADERVHGEIYVLRKLRTET